TSTWTPVLTTRAFVAAPLLDSSSGWACTAISRNEPSQRLSRPEVADVGSGCSASASARSLRAGSTSAAACSRLAADIQDPSRRAGWTADLAAGRVAVRLGDLADDPQHECPESK